MSWVPDTGIMSAGALPGQRQILACTREGIVWRIRLGDDLSLSGVDTALADVEFTRFTVLDGARGVVIGSSPGGLFRIEPDNSSTLLAEGSFVNADVYPSHLSPAGIVAVSDTGAVEFYRMGGQ